MSDVVRTAPAARQARVVLTESNDFAAIVFCDKLPIVGFALVELHGFRRDARAARIVDAMCEISHKAVGKVHVVEPVNIRSRDLP